MLLLDAAFRFAGITILLLVAVISLRDARHLLQGRLAGAMCICLSGMLINTIPEWYNPPFALEAIGWILHVPNIVLLWLFALSLFEDDFKMQRIHWAALGASFILLPGIQTSIYFENQISTLGFVIVNRILGFSLLAHLFWTAWSGWKDDLIEARRRTRLWFILGLGTTALVILSGESIHYGLTFDNNDPDWFTTARTIIALPMILIGALWFLKLLPETLLFERTSRPAAVSAKVDPKDTATHTRLVAAMETEFLYREQGLGIGDLAAKLSVPEHQLRALINKGLGYRNFAAFLNQYRLTEAKAALADPEQARTPILTIAMDVGYASLATFNRAFKTEEGTTPSAYRAEALENVAQS
ncbi:MAG: helix-turn-helix domain-containing protein [Pseudomonadota bacterium]